MVPPQTSQTKNLVGRTCRRSVPSVNANDNDVLRRPRPRKGTTGMVLWDRHTIEGSLNVCIQPLLHRDVHGLVSTVLAGEAERVAIGISVGKTLGNRPQCTHVTIKIPKCW